MTQPAKTVTPERWRRIEELYHAALERAPAERAAFLGNVCGTDLDLRREVESLLAEDASRTGMLDHPAVLLPHDGTQLSAGSQLGTYRIEALIGKGGMGEVWKARDTRLNRDVAIKMSAEQFTDRFEREARAVAALNHPNICTLYHIGPNYLVMEYIEGTPLKGPLPLDQALKYAEQICDALDAAHRKGITHRDLKPGNILVSKHGIKLLDFGLAQMAPGPDDPTMMPTAGVIGTPAYMAPEQWEGKRADARSDIYSFGCVLYEMLTGKRTAADRIPVAPPLEDILRTCLKKDPDERWQSAREVKHALHWAAEAKPVSSAPSRSRFSTAGWIAAGVFAVGAIGVGVVAWGRFAEQPQLMRMTLQTPEKAAPFYWVNHPMISPDGRRVVFPAAVDGKSGLWLRDLDALSARLLPGTDGAILPFWSPDSRWVAFFVEGTAGKLKKIDVTGGSAITLCDVIRGREGAWNQDGVIVYGVFPGGLFRVPATGGIPTPLTVPDAAATEVNHRSPWFLPDGRRFLYTARSDDPEKTRIYVDSIDAKPGSTTRREVLAANSNAVYVPRIHAGLRGSADDGYLLFVRDSTLMAQPFDAASARTTGNAVPVAEQVDYDSYGSSQGQFSASRNGILVYTSGSPVSGEAQLTWFHRTGKPGGTVGSPGLVGAFSLSPDGSTVAAVRGGASRPFDIWLHDLAHGTASRFTFGPHNNMLPVWSPDGSRLAYYRDHTGINLPWQKAASGTGLEERLDEDPRTHVLTDWSRDGRYLIETVSDPKTDTDIWVFPTFGDKKPFPYVRTEFAEGQGKLSPDGKFLAYRSSESGRSAVYVQTFPEHGGKWQISNGSQPVWSRDGRELYFLSADNKMMAVEVKGSGKNFDAGVPKALFPVPNQAQFDVSKDGRFLIHVPQAKAATSVPLTVVVNWQAGLKK